MGIHSVDKDDAGRAVVTLSGVFGPGDAVSLSQALAEALSLSNEVVLLCLEAVEQGDVPFFQVLFSLCLQAQHDGKRVVLAGTLSSELCRQAALLGIGMKDFESHITSEGV